MEPISKTLGNRQASLLSVKSKGQFAVIVGYTLKRYDEKPVKISVEDEAKIQLAINKNVKFVKIGDWTFNTSSIKEVEPIYENKVPEAISSSAITTT